MKHPLLMAVGACMLCACEKKELPAPAFDRGDVITQQLNMGANYKSQLWYSLSENRVIASNTRTDWDLAFEASQSGNHIMLNGSKGMRVHKTLQTDLSLVTDTVGLEANSRIDAPSGKLDSTALGNWDQPNTVYIINRGYSDDGIHQGYTRLKVLSVNASGYVVQYGDAFGGPLVQATVHKHPDYNFVMLSLSTAHELYVEPKKTDYDLCFTAYTHFFTNPFQFYQVAGVLQNSYRVRTLRLRNKPFAQIALADTLGRSFSADRNAIGYDWKEFSLTTNVYAVRPDFCYIIQDSKGFFYKLHFIDFYSSSGLKGAPRFEFKKL